MFSETVPLSLFSIFIQMESPQSSFVLICPKALQQAGFIGVFKREGWFEILLSLGVCFPPVPSETKGLFHSPWDGLLCVIPQTAEGQGVF